ncbi:MAG: RDD family protein [Ilumatobacteraceae bacterium]
MASSGEYAGFWIRFAAYLLDRILYGLVWIVLLIPGIVLLVLGFSECDGWTSNDEWTCTGGDLNAGAIAGGVALILASVVVILVLYVRALGRTGQTWGRRIVGIKVVRLDDGRPIGVPKAIGRSLFAEFVSGQVFVLGYLWALWDDRKQTWHDKIVGSVVVRV